MASYTADKLKIVVGSDEYILDPELDLSSKVTGPANAVDNHVPTFDGTTGKIIKDSGYTIGKSVPSNAVFTDTTYSSKQAASGGTDVSLVTTGEKYTWNEKTNAIDAINNRLSVNPYNSWAEFFSQNDAGFSTGIVVGSTSDKPSGITASCDAIQMKYSSSYAVQFCMTPANEYVYYRRYNNGTWTAWDSFALNSTFTAKFGTNYGNTSTPITNLDDLPINGTGSVVLAASLAPSGAVTTYSFVKSGVVANTRYNVLIKQLNSTGDGKIYYGSVYNGVFKGWAEIALESDRTTQTQYANGETKGMPATAGTGVTIDTTKAYTRAVKRNGIVYLQLRMQIPSDISDDTVIATLHSDLKPIVDMSYLPCFNLWDRTISGCMTVSSTDGNIRANHDCAGKNLSLIITYPALNY